MNIVSASDTKKIQRIDNLDSSVDYLVFIRKSKRSSWIYLGTVPEIKLAHALVKAGRKVYNFENQSKRYDASKPPRNN